MRGFKTSTTALAIALGVGMAGTAAAQNHDFKLNAHLSFASSQKDTWNTVLIVSAAVMVVGLIQQDNSLTLLGGAGVLVSLVETNKYGYQPQWMPHGINFAHSGPLSFGMNPFGQLGPVDGFKNMRPSLYVTANFKF